MKNTLTKRQFVFTAIATAAMTHFALAQPVDQEQAVRDLIAKAPVLAIGLDNSGSSAATDDKLVAAAWPTIEEKIRAMPMASKIVVFTFADASAPYVSGTWRVQKKQTDKGAPVDIIVQEIKKVVLPFPSKLRSGSMPVHGRSDLIGGFYDAGKLLNEQSKDNAIVMISDLIENSNLANCYSDAKCRLPAPKFSLKGADVTVLGVGYGFPSDRQMAVTTSWLDFLKKAGANVSLDKLKRLI